MDDKGLLAHIDDLIAEEEGAAPRARRAGAGRH